MIPLSPPGLRRSDRAAGRGCPDRAITVSLFLLAVTVPAGAAAQLSVQPVIVEMRVQDRPTGTGLVVRNEGTEPMVLQVYAMDFDQSPSGAHTFLPAGEHPRSCGERLRVFPESVELAPGSVQEVSLTMAPGEATCWSVVFVQTVPGGTGITVAQRVGVKVYGVPPGASIDGELGGVALEPSADGRGMRVRLEFANRGESPLRPQGELEVRTLDGEVVNLSPLPAFSVLPGRVRTEELLIELDLPPGEYLAIPILDFGGDYLAGGQAVFRVPES